MKELQTSAADRTSLLSNPPVTMGEIDRWARDTQEVVKKAWDIEGVVDSEEAIWNIYRQLLMEIFAEMSKVAPSCAPDFLADFLQQRSTIPQGFSQNVEASHGCHCMKQTSSHVPFQAFVPSQGLPQTGPFWRGNVPPGLMYSQNLPGQTWLSVSCARLVSVRYGIWSNIPAL